MSADEFRYLTIALTLLAGLLFPWAIYYRVQTRAAVLVVVVLVINFVGASVAIADSIGEPIVWYRTPRICVASVLALIYCAIAFSSPRPRVGLRPTASERSREPERQEAHDERPTRTSP